jgi:hypothetical protein
MIPKINLTTAFHILRDTFVGFIEIEVLGSAALSYYLVSLAPLFIVNDLLS